MEDEYSKKDNKLTSTLFKTLKNKLKSKRVGSTSDFNRKDQNDPYLYITNFEQVTDEECLAADKKNESIYNEELQTYKDVTSLMDRRNASFMKPTAPKPPPKPSNIEKLYEYRRKYIKTQALEQTEAVIYLHTIGKKYVREKTDDPNEFEAYEAIELANAFKEKFKGEKMFQDIQDRYIWSENSEKMTQELSRRSQSRSKSRSNFHSVYDSPESPAYQERSRSVSYSSDDVPIPYHYQGLYPVIPSAPTASASDTIKLN
jgi:hypothetical protein